MPNMAEAAIESFITDHAEPPTAAMTATNTVLSRNHDPLTMALRSKTELNLSLDELVNLNRTDPPREYASTLGTLTNTVFSSQKKSSMTKQTSTGTSYILNGRHGNGQDAVVKMYASSLSATQGSASEAEAEAEAEQDNALFGVGDQFENNTLRGAARARKRLRTGNGSRPKKVPLIIHYEPASQMSSEENLVSVTKHNHGRSKGIERSHLRPRKSKSPVDQVVLADEERVSHRDNSSPARRFSRARTNVIIGLCVLIVLTLALSIFAAHHTGKGRLACTKGIIFCATVLISVFTILAMYFAKRALQESLLAGLLEFVVGFALVIEIHDFMGHIT